MINISGRGYAHEKQYRRGTHRTRSPRETIEDYSRFMRPMGITRLANLTGLDRIGLPVYTAIRPNARSLATSQGKGFDRDSAKASALVECIEFWHAENIEKQTIDESYLALRDRHAAADITKMTPIPGRPVRLDASRSWVEGWDLMSERPMWVPNDSVTMDMVFTGGYNPTFFVSSNGLAGGNHILEAIVHALCELIERDADVEWRTNDELRQIDLSAIKDPYCTWTMDRLHEAGVRVAAWDMTTSNGIPSVTAAVLEKPDRSDWRSLGVSYGAGSHLSPGVALMRAISEAVQTRLTYIAGSRDDLYHEDYAQHHNLDYTNQVWEETFQSTAASLFHLRPDASTDTFEGDVEFLLATLRGMGIESAVAVDLTKPEIGIPVVKMVVPGLREPVGESEEEVMAA